jgi:glycosyltransferase involved in cell wall biosynthesis
MPPLVFAGPTVGELVESGIDPERLRDVRVLGRVPDDDLPALYSGARALVLPSLHEGLGLTPLEAMACGTPVVVSDGGALPDTVGDAGLVVPARDVDAWHDAVDRVVHDDALRSRLAQAGTARVATRDWQECARSYLSVYEEVAA